MSFYIAITQAALEVANHGDTQTRITQLTTEIANHPPNSTRITQIVIEVAMKLTNNYTDGAIRESHGSY